MSVEKVADLRAAVASTAASGSVVTHIPKAKNFPAIDAVLPGNFLVIVTLDKSHKLLLQGKRKDSGVIPLSRKLGMRGPVTLVWAIPDDRFEDFCRQGKPAAFVCAGLPVEQFFLRVPPPPWAAAGQFVGYPSPMGASR